MCAEGLNVLVSGLPCRYEYQTWMDHWWFSLVQEVNYLTDKSQRAKEGRVFRIHCRHTEHTEFYQWLENWKTHPTETKISFKVMACAFNPSTWKVESNRTLGVQGQFGLHSEFLASQDCIVRLCIKINKMFLLSPVTGKSRILPKCLKEISSKMLISIFLEKSTKLDACWAGAVSNTIIFFP